MQFLRVRMSVRRWLIASAIIATLLGCEHLLRLRARYLEIANAEASRVYDYGEGRGFHCAREEWLDQAGNFTPKFHVFCDEVRDRAAKLERKYRFAASHPWLVVEPDPPSL
jgi:hypothetical protein